MQGNSHKQEFIKLLQKSCIAILVWYGIFFYNTENTNTPTPEKKQIHEYIKEKEHYASRSGEDTIIKNNMSQLSEKIKIDTDRSIEEQENIKQTTINSIINISDTLLSKEKIIEQINTITINKEKSTSRGYSSHNSIVINYGTMNTKEFEEVLNHELGHLLDLGVLKGYSSKKNNQFSEFKEFVFEEDDPSLLYYALSRESEEERKKESTKQDFCSVYGMTNPFEDFAECFNLYIYHHQYFYTLSQKNKQLKEKYNYISVLLGNNYLSDGNQQENKKGISYRYWDTTRIL